PRGGDFPWVRNDLAVELDLPQLGSEPEGEVADPARVDADSADVGRRSLDPLADRPAKAGERRDGPIGEELVGVHAGLQSRNAARSSFCSAAGMRSGSSRPVSKTVSRICSRYVEQPSQKTRCPSTRSRWAALTASRRYAVTIPTPCAHVTSWSSLTPGPPRAPAATGSSRGARALVDWSR